ncbi:unnamed protein product (macronuclear) [Paramecium tetraurelia]|uniref:Uncharacterized protein n=1 Tax=Paramecium tetraurelia TaxID=5888 RepID=A0C4L1_PARTE|nr:uncharacterized protein GSPATT00006227001 [Paramecium tetraurelia]CAK65728.1 unnamed protein product [Paramecium tetraurelia]|eukprot:XP_001433125.1 hypothetical protein (macronuclear) [Paramecium tetraurelia strain d4-2]
MIYRPLLIETCQYKYRMGSEEKSFSIKKKVDYYPFFRQKVSQSFHIEPLTADKKRSKRQLTLNPKLGNSDINIQQYIEFNIKEQPLNTQTNKRVRKLIIQDNKLLRKQNKINVFAEIATQKHKSYHQQQIKKQVTTMLDQGQLFRKVESPQMSAKAQQKEQQKQLEFQSKTQQNNAEQQIQDKVQNYLSRKSVHLQRLSQRMDDINVSKGSIIQTSSAERDLKISSTFFKDFIGVSQQLKNKEKQDPELLKESYKYWAQAIRTKKDPLKKRKVGAVFSTSIRVKLEKMRALILDCVKKLRFMKLDPEQLMQSRTILKQPYQREGSYVFFKGVTKNDLDLVKLMLDKCRFYAFDVNENFQTALHVCARKGYLQIAKLLFQLGTYPDVRDVSNRTPLYYALINNQKELVQLLLSHKCNPWSFPGCTYETDDPVLTKMLKIARRLDMLLLMTPYNTRQSTWINYCRVFYEF